MLQVPRREDRTIRILTQSDPMSLDSSGKFVQLSIVVGICLSSKELIPLERSSCSVSTIILKSRTCMFRQRILRSSVMRSTSSLKTMLDQLVDVAILTNVNSEPISELSKPMRDGLERIGFKQVGERMIRGGVVDPQLGNCRTCLVPSTPSASGNTTRKRNVSASKNKGNSRRFRSSWSMRSVQNKSQIDGECKPLA